MWDKILSGCIDAFECFEDGSKSINALQREGRDSKLQTELATTVSAFVRAGFIALKSAELSGAI